MHCYRDYRFYQRILEYLLRKIEIFEIQNIFRISSFTICFILFFSIFNIFFSILPPNSHRKILIISLFFIVWIRDLSKNFTKLWVFFQENLKYLKSKISPKFHNLLFLSYFFSIFDISFFSISPIQTCEKIIEFFVVFYWKDKRFYQRILEISKRLVF